LNVLLVKVSPLLKVEQYEAHGEALRPKLFEGDVQFFEFRQHFLGHARNRFHHEGVNCSESIYPFTTPRYPRDEEASDTVKFPAPEGESLRYLLAPVFVTLFFLVMLGFVAVAGPLTHGIAVWAILAVVIVLVAKYNPRQVK
jgi:hypothetical protein